MTGCQIIEFNARYSDGKLIAGLIDTPIDLVDISVKWRGLDITKQLNAQELKELEGAIWSQITTQNDLI